VRRLSSFFHRRLLPLLSGPAIIDRVNRVADPARRTAAAIVAAAAVALLVAACGGSPASNSTPPSSQQPGALAFAGCMRSNGVPNYPDPTAGGLVKESLQQLGVSSSQFQGAQRACRRLLPNGGNGPTAAQVQQGKAQALRFARCVRAHGVPNFPDPDSTGRIPDPAGAGIDQGAPKFEAANAACGKDRPPYMPSNAAYNAYARTHG
jgi:hypothetical protein